MLPNLPEQRVSQKKKETLDWQTKCIEALVGRATSAIAGNRSSKLAKQSNYDMFNSIINLDDFTHVTKPYGLDAHNKWGNMPANFQDYNVVRSSVMQLVGEESRRPFNWKVIATGGDGFNSRLTDMKESLDNAYLSILRESLGEQVETQDPAEIDKYFKYSYTSKIEITANKLLKHLVYSQRLENIFNKGYLHALISAEEVYYADIIHGEPKIMPWNPINFECDKSSDTEFIEDHDWGVGRVWLDRGQVLDWFGDKMSKAQKEKLRSDNVFNSNATYGMAPEIIPTTQFNNNWNNNVTKILVSIAAWKSEKKIGFLEYIDPKGILVKTVVDEDFEEAILEINNVEYTLEWEWVPRCWIGVQIGPDIFFAFEREYQDNTIDNPYKCKLPFIGKVYNAVNSYPTSLVELLKPYQYLYNIVWYKLELELARSKGKKFVMDVAQLPKSKGWTMEQWMYYFDSLGIAFINSAEEGREGDSSSVSKFNQFTSVDMTMSNAINGYFLTLSKIEERIEEVTGITRQRKGNIGASETVGGTERSIAQSNALTELYFIEHNMVKERVLEALLEVAKICYANNEKGKLVFDDHTREILETSDILNSDFGLYVTNSNRENATLEALKNLAKEGISSGTLNFSNLVTLYKSNSIAEVEEAVKSSEEKQNKFKEQEQQTAQAQVDSQERIARETLDREDNNKQLDRENKIQVAQIGSLKSKDGATDFDGNGIIDQLEVGKFSLEQSRESFKQQESGAKLSLEMKKMELEQANFQREQLQQDKKNAQDAIFKAKELDLKEKDIEVKKKALKYKAKPATKK